MFKNKMAEWELLEYFTISDCLFNRLTAFVVKSFSQASDFITIDENVVQKAVTWLVSQQNENGTFREPGRVLHKEMQVRHNAKR